MIDPTPGEITALEHAGAVGGEYLESVGKAESFTNLSWNEWMTLVETVVTAYLDRTLDPHVRVDGVPF